jgi:hypothetical protein
MEFNKIWSKSGNRLGICNFLGKKCLNIILDKKDGRTLQHCPFINGAMKHELTRHSPSNGAGWWMFWCDYHGLSFEEAGSWSVGIWNIKWAIFGRENCDFTWGNVRNYRAFCLSGGMRTLWSSRELKDESYMHGVTQA